jgi:UDP-N-acetylglucosamine--N-acetylmuramyl-(pentapeptide) pyrophosphoryl-undecaprenol N-acetylglucosamine transferase
VSEAIADLVERCVVVHITGAGGIDAAEADRSRLPIDRQDRYRPFSFLDKDMGAALASAQIVVGRAGSSTLAECAAAGIPLVIVPYPHAAAHQRANAAEMVEAGAAVLVDDADLDGDTLREACDLLFDERLAVMSAAAGRLGRPGSAAASAHLLVQLASGGTIPSQAEIEPMTRSRA